MLAYGLSVNFYHQGWKVAASGPPAETISLPAKPFRSNIMPVFGLCRGD